MRSLILIGSVCLALAACNSPPFADENVNTNSNVVVPENQGISETGSGCGITSSGVADEKALLSAETAYNIPAQAYVKLGSNLSAANRTAVRGYLIQAYDYLKLAREAYNAGDNCSLVRYRDLTQSVGDKAKALLPK